MTVAEVKSTQYNTKVHVIYHRRHYIQRRISSGKNLCYVFSFKWSSIHGEAIRNKTLIIMQI